MELNYTSLENDSWIKFIQSTSRNQGIRDQKGSQAASDGKRSDTKQSNIRTETRGSDCDTRQAGVSVLERGCIFYSNISLQYTYFEINYVQYTNPFKKHILNGQKLLFHLHISFSFSTQFTNNLSIQR